MRLVVDARSLLPVQPGLGPTGVGRWTAGVLRGLARAAPEWQIDLLLVHKDGEVDPAAFGPNFGFESVRMDERWARRLRVFGLLPKIDRYIGTADVLLGPAFFTWKSDAPELLVIHDLTHVKHPGYVSPRNLWFMRATLNRNIRRAARLITVSDAMRSEIASHYNVDRDRIAVVPNGYDEELVSQAADAPLPEGIPDDYLLFVGTKEPRKNLEGAIAGHTLARSRIGARVPPLVVAGGKGWQDERLTRALSGSERGAVIDTGYVDDLTLFALYRQARALLFPSHYEGFGLPVLEAMASGCPVVTTSVGGIPEVAGDAVSYVEPSDPDSIANTLVELLTNEALRSELVERGRVRARAYTWTASGRALRAAVELAASGR